MPTGLLIEREDVSSGVAGRGPASGPHEVDRRAYLASTLAVRGGWSPDPVTGAVVTPIVQSATYAQDEVGSHRGHTYSRASNPTVEALERGLAALEGAPGSVAFSSGLSAVSTLFLATLRSGDEVVVSDVVYGGTVRLLRQVLADLGVTARFVDTSDLGAVAAALNERTRLVFIETPANPTLKLTDVAAVSSLAAKAGALVAVDNTFLTPVVLRPLDLGADVSLYSTTKLIEGHNATIGGAITARDPALVDRLRFIRKSLGTIQSPFEAWLTLRGLKTLPLRVREQSRSAQVVARFLERHPGVERVHYPGLASFPQAELARRQHRAWQRDECWHGQVVSFEVVGGAEAGVRFINALRLCTLAESLGAVETLVTHPVSMTHGDVPREQRLATGITDGLVRLSVGLEDAVDIIEDLDRALGVAAGGAGDDGKGVARG